MLHDAPDNAFSLIEVYPSGGGGAASVRGYKDITMLVAEATCSNFDARQQGSRLLEIADDFFYSWNFIAV